ncbi:MAG: hypothetical protein NTX53_21660 [candidate division WOR-3 bacterium]|nr:hypothetical protein [candidate division WOR-3 bacterium]
MLAKSMDIGQQEVEAEVEAEEEAEVKVEGVRRPGTEDWGPVRPVNRRPSFVI